MLITTIAIFIWLILARWNCCLFILSIIVFCTHLFTISKVSWEFSCSFKLQFRVRANLLKLAYTWDCTHVVFISFEIIGFWHCQIEVLWLLIHPFWIFYSIIPPWPFSTVLPSSKHTQHIVSWSLISVPNFVRFSVGFITIQHNWLEHWPSEFIFIFRVIHLQLWIIESMPLDLICHCRFVTSSCVKNVAMISVSRYAVSINLTALLIAIDICKPLPLLLSSKK